MNHEVRLVITEDLEGKPIVIVTNDFNLSAEEISDIYRYRWKIELFLNGSNSISKLSTSSVKEAWCREPNLHRTDDLLPVTVNQTQGWFQG